MYHHSDIHNIILMVSEVGELVSDLQYRAVSLGWDH